MSFRKICLAVNAILLGLTLVACEKKEGPAEKMGKEVDKAAEKTGQGDGQSQQRKRYCQRGCR